jgi:hypothetical protein
MRTVPSLRHTLRISLFLSNLVTAVALSQAVYVADAHAESGKTNVAVGGFEGAKADDARAAFIEALKKDGGYEVTDAEDIKPSTKGKAIVEAAKGLAVNAVIVGKVGKGGLKLKVFDGANGKVLGEAEIKGAGNKLKTNIEKTGAASVGDAFGKAKPKEEEKKKEEAPPPAEEAKPDEEEDKPADEKPADSGPSSSGGLSPFDVTAGLRPMHRTFTFHDTIADARPKDGFGQLLKYELPLGPVLFIDLNWYPASHFMQGPAEWIGISAGFEKGFATQSVYAEGQKDAAGKSLEQTLKTDEQAFYVGPRFRLPIGEHQLGLSGTFGQHTFFLNGDDDKPLIPDVKYTYARVGIDGTFRFGDFLAGAHVGKRFVLDTGRLETVWFKTVKTQSLDAGVMVGYRLVKMLDLVAGFDWLRYGFDFNPVQRRPGLESYVAGGAVDEYMSGYIAFRFHVPGQGEARPADD